MKYIFYICLFFITIISISCNATSASRYWNRALLGDSPSFVMIGESKKQAESVTQRMVEFFGAKTSTVINSRDTIIFITVISNSPFESMSLFENDECIYQELNVYCSPCADEMLENILKDWRYKFKAVDKVNYRSTTNIDVVMRLKDASTDENTCQVITIHKI